MRKYFLTSAVALMAATNVSASTSYYDSIYVTADIITAERIDCENIEFGEITVLKNNESFEISWDGSSTSQDFISLTGNGYIKCKDHEGNSIDDVNTVILQGGVAQLCTDGGNCALSVRHMAGDAGLTLSIPENVVPDHYQATVILTATY